MPGSDWSALALVKLAGVTIRIPSEKFISEHERLIRVLRDGTAEERLAEAREQYRDLRRAKLSQSETALIGRGVKVARRHGQRAVSLVLRQADEVARLARMAGDGQEQEEKAGTLAAGLMNLNMAAAVPYMASGLGGAMKWLGGKGVPGMSRAGNYVGGIGDFAVRHTERFLNTGPGPSYSLKNLPGAIRKPLGWIGMDTTSRLRMTPQRAAVWAGGALAVKDMVSPPKPPQIARSDQPDFGPAGSPYMKAAADFGRLTAALED